MSHRASTVMNMTAAMRTPGGINLAAEVRGVEEGHQCRLSSDEKVLLVISDTEPGVTYHLRPLAVGDRVMIHCDCPHGTNNSPSLGVMTCKHQTRVCRRLERLGLVSFDGSYWKVTEKAFKLLCRPCVKSGCTSRARDPYSDRCIDHDDPFAGLR